jgi:chorismate synthase
MTFILEITFVLLLQNYDERHDRRKMGFLRAYISRQEKKKQKILSGL